MQSGFVRVFDLEVEKYSKVPPAFLKGLMMRFALVASVTAISALLCTFSFANAGTSTYGAVSGTLTWQFNEVVGTKGDVGATATLLPIRPKCKFPSQESFTTAVILGLDEGRDLKRCGILITKADGYGHFKIQRVPEGKYHLLVVSYNTHRHPDEPIDEYTRSGDSYPGSGTGEKT